MEVKMSAKKLIICLTLTALLFFPSFSSAQQETGGNILILYYSLTGNTKACCEALQKELGADILEIKDLKKRPGFTTAIGSLFGMHTKIEPETPNLAPYSHIIPGSPIWTGKMSMAIRTLIDKNDFGGKKVIIFTTTNAYEQEKYKEKSRNLVREKGGEVVGYYQVLAKKEVNEEKVERGIEPMIEDTLTFVPEIKKAFLITE
jgi:flavodoxin